jgi:hypothetical protein
MMMTNIAAMGGTKMEAVLTATAAPVSTVDTNGFANPPVAPVEANLPVAFAPLMAVAVPPPAIMAKDHVMTGSILLAVETTAAVPAIPAKGRAIVSRALSTQGMKYAKISTTVAIPKVMRAVRLPIHCQLSFSSHTPKYAAKLRAKRGKKTRKPARRPNQFLGINLLWCLVQCSCRCLN